MKAPSSILMIPPEIQGEIFSYLVLGKSLRIPSDDFNTLLHVTRTCSSWRLIALQHPHLWSDLDIRMHSWSDQSTIHAATLCLQYSAGVSQSSLAVRLHVERHINHWVSLTGIHSPDFLIPHAHRIRKLSVLFPLSLTQLTLPQLTDLEVLTHDLEGSHMNIPALLQRSGNVLIRLSVGCVLDWHTLLDNAPHIEKLETEGTIPDDTMRSIAKGKIGIMLREVKCAVALHDCDIFLEMLEARATGITDIGICGAVTAIAKVEAQCVDFALDARQWARVQVLEPLMQIVVIEA